MKRKKWSDLTGREKIVGSGCLIFLILGVCGFFAWAAEEGGNIQATQTAEALANPSNTPDPAVAERQTERADQQATMESARATNDAKPTRPPPTDVPKATRPPSGMTMAMFSQIETGMTSDQVNEIMGGHVPCEESSRSEIAGIVTVMFTCEGDATFSSATLMFQNGELVSKSQFGLE